MADGCRPTAGKYLEFPIVLFTSGMLSGPVIGTTDWLLFGWPCHSVPGHGYGGN
jgi:hypothetical protein